MTEATSRPMLYAVYAKPWFTDANNFPSDAPLFDHSPTPPPHAPSTPPPDAPPDAPPPPRAMAWLRCHDAVAPSVWDALKYIPYARMHTCMHARMPACMHTHMHAGAWDALGRRVRHDRVVDGQQEGWAPLPTPPARVQYGGAPGDEGHEWMSRCIHA